MRTENRVYPALCIQDLDEDAFETLRKGIWANNHDHPWLAYSNEEILHSGEMIMTDPETGKSGLTLAAILLFGKQHTIASVLPTYRIDLLCRISNTDLYDDREIVRCNLLKAFPVIMAFITKHLPEQPYIEGMQRFSLRDRILREVVLNLLIHREYSGAFPASFTIFKDFIVTENWNIPFVYGHIDLQTMRPHRKNPTIANVFSQMGIVEELGSGIKRMFKYTPFYANGRLPSIEEDDVFRIEIPYNPIMIGSGMDNGQKTTQKTTQETTQKTTQKILYLMKDNPNISIEELALKLELTRDGINYQIRKMKKEGLIRRIGPDKGGHWEVKSE